MDVERIDDEDLEWSIIGFDKDGYKIPAKYSFPLYIRKNPFAPPKLNKPQLLKKGRKTSLLYNYLIPKVYAADLKRTLFSWQAIEGATLYNLEISEARITQNNNF